MGALAVVAGNVAVERDKATVSWLLNWRDMIGKRVLPTLFGIVNILTRHYIELWLCGRHHMLNGVSCLVTLKVPCLQAGSPVDHWVQAEQLSNLFALGYGVVGTKSTSLEACGIVKGPHS